MRQGVDFNFPSPYPNFNRQLVYGRISTLFRVKDVNRFGIALSEIAGGKLYQVVVEKAQVAIEILNSK